MNERILKIRRKEPDESRIITVRLKTALLSDLDRISFDANLSRNELINLLLRHGLKHLEIE